jgi:hypothetical protein
MEETRKKGDIVSNYNSYELELQEIMGYFQNAQSEAKEFLARRGRNEKKATEVHFSFADF